MRGRAGPTPAMDGSRRRAEHGGQGDWRRRLRATWEDQSPPRRG
eukprot:gene19470-biopygen17504